MLSSTHPISGLPEIGRRKSGKPDLRACVSKHEAALILRDGAARLLRMRAGRYDSACFTRSGENGTRRMRTPVASKMALAIAAATGRIDGSPAPVGGSSG